MRLPVRFEEEADAEFTAAVRWFEERRRGFGASFFDAVQAALELIREYPEAGSTEGAGADPEVRRVLVRRFPYEIVYHVRPKEIVVVAVAHTSRRPGYWKERI